MRLVKEIAPRISVDPGVCFGKPVVAGTRLHVSVVLGQLAAGMTADEVCEEYGIKREDVLACLAYAAHLVQDEEIRALP